MLEKINSEIIKNENYELIKDNPNYIVLCAKNEGKIVQDKIYNCQYVATESSLSLWQSCFRIIATLLKISKWI